METEFVFNEKTYRGVGRTKQKSIADFMFSAENDVLTYLKNVKNN